jgi:hypothetical protein
MSPVCQSEMTLPEKFFGGVRVTTRLMGHGELTWLEDLDGWWLTTETLEQPLGLETIYRSARRRHNIEERSCLTK